MTFLRQIAKITSGVKPNVRFGSFCVGVHYLTGEHIAIAPFAVAFSEISNDGNSKTFHTHVPCHDDFWYCGHAYSVSAHLLQHSDFRRSLIAGPADSCVNSLSQFQTHFPGTFQCQLTQSLRIAFTHIGKTWTKDIQVESKQRIGHKKTHMVTD